VGFIEIIFVDRRDAKCTTNVIIGKIIGFCCLLAVEKSQIPNIT
jgi:hypothetical protein